MDSSPRSDSDALLPNIFSFLILLSYERYHSKVIISFAKVIQLCDGILASGLDPVSHSELTIAVSSICLSFDQFLQWFRCWRCSCRTCSWCELRTNRPTPTKTWKRNVKC